MKSCTFNNIRKLSRVYFTISLQSPRKPLELFYAFRWWVVLSYGLFFPEPGTSHSRRDELSNYGTGTASPAIQWPREYGPINNRCFSFLFSATGLKWADELRSLALAECPYVTDEVLQRVGQLSQLHRLLLDLTGCDKTTAAGVRGMLSGGCERVHELRLTVPLDADYLDAVAAAVELPRLREFRLTFDRLSSQDRADDRCRPSAHERLRELAARFRARHVDLVVGHSFTKIAVSVDWCSGTAPSPPLIIICHCRSRLVVRRTAVADEDETRRTDVTV